MGALLRLLIDNYIYSGCCECFCSPCLTYKTAEDLGKSGILYCLLGCIMPCIPALLMRQEARERYNIEGDTTEDVGLAFCCTSCVKCQTAVEIKREGTAQTKSLWRIYGEKLLYV